MEVRTGAGQFAQTDRSPGNQPPSAPRRVPAGLPLPIRGGLHVEDANQPNGRQDAQNGVWRALAGRNVLIIAYVAAGRRQERRRGSWRSGRAVLI